MTKLEQLIKELCPEGVEYCELGEICSLVTGATPSKVKNDYWENGTISWMSSGEVNNKIIYDTEQKITQLGYNSASTTIVPVHSIVIALAGQGKTRGKVAMTEIELCTNQSLCSMICGERIFYKFLYYYLDSKYLELREISNGDGARGGLSLKILSPYKVPVPPIEVQYEIVRILDNFTEVTVELTEKLTAELTARKQQYEYYKNIIFSSCLCEKVILGDVLQSIHTGLNPRKFFMLNTNDANNYYVTIREFKGGKLRFTDKTDRINDEALKLCNNRSNLEIGDVLFSGTGTIGEVFVIEEKPSNWNIKEGVYSLKPKPSRVLAKYLKHYLSSKEMMDKYETLAEGGTVKSISMKKMEAMEILLPSIAEQERIVTILDRFEDLCDDITTGLPAEIEARQKQYEYYRDKLLTFKEKVV